MKFRFITSTLLAVAVGVFAFVVRGDAVSAGVAFAAALGVGLFVQNRRLLRRRRMDRAPFPDAWRAVLDEYVDFYDGLEGADQARFERDVRYFVEEHTIAGPRGIEVEEELKVLVGASAALLSFGQPGYIWERVRDVIIYPEAFDDEYVTSSQGNILGQVGRQSSIIFSARALRQGFAAGDDGLNVGLHEMAHVLDFDGGPADGVPSLMPWHAVRGWLGVVHDEVQRIDAHRSVLRQYGATNEAEFFAVATEAFFERPTQLRKKHPELYEMLRKTYAQNPAGPPEVDDEADERSPEARRRRRNERKRRQDNKDKR